MIRLRTYFFYIFLALPSLAFCQGLDNAKAKCIELGFISGTEKFGTCVLRLTSSQERPIANRVNFTIQGPIPIVDNGGIVPLMVTFNPPLMTGASAKILVNKEVAYEIQVLEGFLSTFNARLLFPTNPTLVTVECPGCTGVNYESEVRLVSRLQLNSSPPVSIRAVKSSNDIKFLIAVDSTTHGNFTVSGNGFKVNVLLSKYVVRNPFFGFVGSIGSGQYCGEFVTSGSVKSCADN